jgi:isoquinoline 1-oxidoreductase beta subunit
MEQFKPTYSRRSILKSSFLAGGGLMINFTWFSQAGFAEETNDINLPEQWNETKRN